MHIATTTLWLEQQKNMCGVENNYNYSNNINYFFYLCIIFLLG